MQQADKVATQSRERVGEIKTRSAAGAFLIAAIAVLGTAAPSFGAVSCSYSATDRLVSVSATDDFTRVARSGDAIQIDDGHELVPCAGDAPTVLTADLIQITHSGPSAATVDLRGGPLAPGFTPEPMGTSEIELQYLTPTFVDVRGSALADRLGFAGGGANLDGDDDADVTGQFTVLLIEGGGGNDQLSSQSGYTRSAGRRVLLGQGGRDRLLATPDGSVLHGGNGHDRLVGGPGPDNLTGGRGADVIGGAKGRDLVRAIDGSRDRVSCGPGIDRAKVDGIDRVKGCEHLIAVKRRGPVKG
jgi:Ca2+-binding RTX toxin-like protein